MVAATISAKLGGLARTLVQENLLTEAEAEAIQSVAVTQKVPFVTQLIQSKKLSALQVAETAANAFGFPLLNLDAINPDYLPAKTIDPKLMQSSHVLALQNRGNTLFVALSDPTNLHALDTVQFQVGMALSPVVVEDDKLGKWIEKISAASDTSLKSLSVDDDINLEFQTEEDLETESVQSVEIDDAPVVKYIQKLLIDAINLGASDLH